MHEYVKRINAAVLLGVMDPGSVSQVTVAHDTKGRKRCGSYRGRDCDCDPEITISTAAGRFSIQADGSAKPTH
jgi:hypothetical protein